MQENLRDLLQYDNRYYKTSIIINSVKVSRFFVNNYKNPKYIST